MARLLLLISGIAVALSFFFFENPFSDNGGDDASRSFPQEEKKEPGSEAAIDVSTTTVKAIPDTPLPQKKITPVVIPVVPTKSTELVSPVKTAPKVAEPLVHYTEQQKTPAVGMLASAPIVDWTNTYRQENNLKPLQRNTELDAAAIIKVRDMFERQYFEHVSPSGKNSADLVSGVGYEYLWVGENLALGIFSSEKDLVDAWMASPGHRANILNPHFEEIGIGVEEGEYEGRHVWMAVQEFGKPASSCPEPELALKTKIEQNREEIETLSTKVNGLISEITVLKEGSDAVRYNEKVSEYNALIAVLNPLIQNTKSLIDVYNQEINSYNACIGA